MKIEDPQSQRGLSISSYFLFLLNFCYFLEPAPAPGLMIPLQNVEEERGDSPVVINCCNTYKKRCCSLFSAVIVAVSIGVGLRFGLGRAKTRTKCLAPRDHLILGLERPWSLFR
jgi:hypothetical protein